MAISIDPNGDKKDKTDENARFFSILIYLERRAERIMESRRAMLRIAGAVRDKLFDITNLLASRLSAGGQDELERAVGDLQGLTRAADQARVALPSGSGDSGAISGADVDLTSIKMAVETRRDSSNTNASQMNGEGGLQNPDAKTRRASVKARALSALDATMAVGEDKTAAKNVDANLPSDNKLPISDAAVSKADRFKQAFAAADDKADPSLSESSNLSLPTTQPSARSKVALLKLDHAAATNADPTSKSDVSAPTGALIEPPKEGTPKPDRAQSSRPTLPANLLS